MNTGPQFVNQLYQRLPSPPRGYGSSQQSFGQQKPPLLPPQTNYTQFYRNQSSLQAPVNNYPPQQQQYMTQQP